MYMEERQLEIAKIINEKGHISINEIIEAYGISNESARRDLRLLESAGKCKRTHGGAIKPMPVNLMPPRDRDMKTLHRDPCYVEVAREAARLIEEHDTIYITSGSTGFFMLDFLPREFPYTIVVNSAAMADQLKLWDNIELYMVGGKMRMKGTACFVDAMATEFVRNFNFDKAFMTGAGIEAEFGMSNNTPETAEFQRTVIKHAKMNILMMPNVKVGYKAFLKVCDADRFDIMITDWDCVEDEIKKLEDLGVKVIVVPNPEG